ncbi:MAG: type II toxin-antitoxin system VapC family toxin [Ignavibacteriae bacterium]|nr:type II toxin-antitoxin system VapC family toxin [Ignavibacteriota bacterium]
MRIYIDTSVVGGFYDDEFDQSTREFFTEVENGKFILVVSELLEAELIRAPEFVRNHLNKYSIEQIERVELTEEAKVLADRYIIEQVVGATSKADCQHIAIATINKVDVLVSWNFKHIVNLKRIRGYNSVNLKNNYQMLEIRTPKEILES